MSFEGYFQLICKNGHYYTEGLWGEEEDAKCPICHAESIWWNLVDTTNGAFDYEGNCISGHVTLKKKEERRCESCDSCLEVTYKIPQNKGHLKNVD